MLLLLLRNMLWAAWWPYSTMLLAMEKAAQQSARAANPSPGAPPAQSQAQARRQESPTANNAFTTPEISQPVCDLMKLSIEQARRAFEAFAAISEKTWKSLENSSPLGRAGLFALNVKIAEIMRANADANFALAVKLAEAKDVQQAIALQASTSSNRWRPSHSNWRRCATSPRADCSGSKFRRARAVRIEPRAEQSRLPVLRAVLERYPRRRRQVLLDGQVRISSPDRG